MSRAADEVVLARLLARVGGRTGFDLTGYRTDGLLRRARQRAVVVGASDLQGYLDAIDDVEAHMLLEHVLVQVSGWFRDPHVWDCLVDVVLPGICRRGGGPGHLRVWVAGCGQGQEVYTVAACLARGVAEGQLRSWEVLATDVDDAVVASVRTAAFPAAPLAERALALLSGHVSTVPTGPDARHETWQVAESLTAHVRACRHDLRDAPPAALGGPVDLVVCRNVVMYLDHAVQSMVLDRLVAAARPGAVLVLGHAEVPLDRRDALVPVDLAARAYRSIAAPLPGPAAPMPGPAAPLPGPAAPLPGPAAAVPPAVGP